MCWKYIFRVGLAKFADGSWIGSWERINRKGDVENVYTLT